MSSTVLICEDEPHVTKFVALKLDRAGFDVQPAADAETAWQQLLRATPSLLILDYRMPGLDGLPFLEQLREDGLCPDLPVIMLLPPDVELGDDFYRLEMLGDVRLVRKPFSARRLVAIAQEMALPLITA